MRGVLMSFQPLELDWFGGGEVKTLAKAEWQGGMPLADRALPAAGLLPQRVAGEACCRARTPTQPCSTPMPRRCRPWPKGRPMRPILRRFEKTLLQGDSATA
jgi:DNA repair protein RecO (recombination protein O)